MCGRFACILSPENLCKASSYQDKKGIYHLSEWKDAEDNMKYQPCYNIAPSKMTPVVVAKTYFEHDAGTRARVVTPMLWGFAPETHLGTANNHRFSTYNCRIETIQTSPLYSSAFHRGHRCLILTSGFYEWKYFVARTSRQPYFFHLPQKEGICWNDETNWSTTWTKENGWEGPAVLPLAGIFNQWMSPEGKRILNYSIVTMEATEEMEGLHARQPVILETEAKKEAWLIKDKMHPDDLLDLVQQPAKLANYTVSQAVGNVNFNCDACVKRWDPKKFSRSLYDWLIRKPIESVKAEEVVSKKHSDECSALMNLKIVDEEDKSDHLVLPKEGNKRSHSDDEEIAHKKVKNEEADKETPRFILL